MTNKKVYLRKVTFQRIGVQDILDIFEGDVKEDKREWEKPLHNAKVRYFKLEEIK
jgi:hypothetical protein